MTAQTFKSRPSELLDIEDKYVAYCFDEACAYIISQLKEGKQARFTEDMEKSKKENTGLKLLMA